MSSTNYKSVQYRFGTESIKDDDSSEFGLHVVNFYGEESISRPYWFRLNLTSRDPNLDPQDFVNLPGRLSIIRGDQTSYLHGIVSSFELCGRDGDWFMYRAMLSPRLWALSLTHQSRAFQNRSVPEIVRTILEEHGVPHKIDLRESYASKQYVVQYNETDLAFISRLLAHDGIRYSFVQEEQREVMHLFDSRGQDPWVEGPTEVAYRLPDGMVGNNEHISEFVLREQAVPGKVVLRDYNFRDQHADLTTEKETKKKGIGEVYEYGSHHKDRSEGDRLIKVRQEEIDSQQRLIAGRSSCIGFRAGHRFTLSNHHRDDLNEDYLLVRVRHFGGQEQQFGTAGVRDNDKSGLGQDYRNEFGCAPALVSFRTPRLTIVNNFFSESFFDASFESRFSPVFNRVTGDTIINIAGDKGSDHGKFYGLMTANVVGDGPYAAVDENGDYLATMPFDRKGDPSRPLRLAQPYTGAGDAGFHYPAHAGNEIVFACVDGDPDRPLALGFAPNPDHPSPVSSENSSQHIFRTTSNNLYLVEDKEGDENIKLYTPHGETLLDLGKQKVGVGLKTDLNVSAYSGKTTAMHACSGFSFTAWPDGSSGDKVIAKLAPTLSLLSGFWFAYAKQKPDMSMHKPKSFSGKVYQEIKRTAKGSYKFDDFYTTFKTIMKIHGQVGSVRKIFSGAKDDEDPKDPSLWDVLYPDTAGVSFNSEGDFSVLAASSANIVTGLGIGLKAIGSIDLVSGDSVGILSGKGFSAFTYEGDATLASSKGAVKIESRDSNVFVEAGNILSLQSTGNLYMAADKTKKGWVVTSGDEYHMYGHQAVQITSDEVICLEVGQSKLTMKKDGTIELKGKDITLDASNSITQKAMKDFKMDAMDLSIDVKKDFKANALKLQMDAKTDAKITGLQVTAEAKVKMDIKGTMTEVAAKAIATIKGALTKAG